MSVLLAPVLPVPLVPGALPLLAAVLLVLLVPGTLPLLVAVPVLLVMLVPVLERLLPAAEVEKKAEAEETEAVAG